MGANIIGTESKRGKNSRLFYEQESYDDILLYYDSDNTSQES